MSRKYLLIFLPVFLWNCGSNDVDVAPPTMEVVSFIPSPTEEDICGSQEPVVFVLNGGDELSFDVLFEDNMGLSQYKVDIHNNFDCHGHGGGTAPSVVAPNVVNLTQDWSVLNIRDLSGVSSSILESLMVPENVTAGNYHFHIQVIDESGNDSPFANYYSLKITNPLDNESPQIAIQQPTSNNLVANRGDVIRFVGQVTDNRSLSDGGNGVLYLAYTDLSSGNTFTTDKAFSFDSNVETTYDFDFEYTIPSTLVDGNYRLSLGANDGVRNVAPFVFFEVNVN